VNPKIAKQITEDMVEYEVCQILDLHRVVWLKTTVKIRSRDPKHHRTGQSKGIPDILARRESWPAGVWIGLELKRPVGWRWTCPEQETVHKLGGSFVVHSAEDAMAAVKATDDALDRSNIDRLFAEFSDANAALGAFDEGTPEHAEALRRRTEAAARYREAKGGIADGKD
jgi:uncharacterized cupin superfamily protein